MATTKQILEWGLRGQAQGFSKAGDLIPLLNETVQLLCKWETPHFLYLDPTTGRPPALPTSKGIFGPYYGPSGTWRVSNVLTRGDFQDDYGLSTSSMSNPVANSMEPIEIGGNYWYPYHPCSFNDALIGGLPTGYFSRDPGDSTTKFYLQCYRTPTQITSDRIEIPIPDSNGAHRLVVFPAFMKLIEGQNHGNYVEAVEYILQNLTPRLWSILGGGAKGTHHRVFPRHY